MHFVHPALNDVHYCWVDRNKDERILPIFLHCTNEQNFPCILQQIQPNTTALFSVETAVICTKNFTHGHSEERCIVSFLSCTYSTSGEPIRGFVLSLALNVADSSEGVVITKAVPTIPKSQLQFLFLFTSHNTTQLWEVHHHKLWVMFIISP